MRPAAMPAFSFGGPPLAEGGRPDRTRRPRPGFPVAASTCTLGGEGGSRHASDV